MTTVRANYRCTQQELYSVLTTIWTNYRDHQAELFAYKAKYTVALETTMKGMIQAAKAMPDEEMRNSESQELRVQCKHAADKCIVNWRKLRGYIQEAYGDEVVQSKLEAAGKNYYDAIGKYNWEQIDGMNTSAKAFMSANSGVLTGSGYMPAGFETDYVADSDAFDTLYDAFKYSRQTTEETDAKILANNNIYAETMKMCEDAKMLYSGNEGVLKKFEFVTVKELVSPPGSASLKFMTEDFVTNEKVPDVRVVIQMEGEPLMERMTNAAGECLFENVDPGVYRCSVEKAGYETQVFNKDVNTGVNARRDVYLMPV
jgi:hypothetical protein